MSPEVLAAASAVVLSLILSYVPGLSAKWDALSGDWKRVVMLVLLALVSAGAFGLSCANVELPNVAVVCDLPGAWGLIQTFVIATIANQTAYALSPGKHG